MHETINKILLSNYVTLICYVYVTWALVPFLQVERNLVLFFFSLSLSRGLHWYARSMYLRKMILDYTYAYCESTHRKRILMTRSRRVYLGLISPTSPLGFPYPFHPLVTYRKPLLARVLPPPPPLLLVQHSRHGLFSLDSFRRRADVYIEWRAHPARLVLSRFCTTIML